METMHWIILLVVVGLLLAPLKLRILKSMMSKKERTEDE